MYIKKIFIIILITIIGFSSKAQLTVVSGSGMTPQQLVQNVLVGTGVTVSNVKFNGSLLAPTNSNQIGSFTTATNATNLGFSTGLLMTTGALASATNGLTTTPITGTEFTTIPELIQYANNQQIRDAAVLEFDFTPLSDTIKFRYAFGSREYPDFVCSNFNDIFGFFITGFNPMGASYVNKNIALVPGTNDPVSINSVNGGVSAGVASNCILTNTQYYHTPIPNITYNGLTTVLTAWALVIPCTPYHMKLAIADLGDNAYDSGVFLEANSFSSPQISINTAYSMPSASTTNAIEGCNNVNLTFTYPYNVTYPYQIPIVSIGGTATNGVDYPQIPNTLIIPTGQNSVQLNLTPFNDHITEPTETIQLVIQTSLCGDLDTLTFNILNYDSLMATAYGDTTICNNTAQLSVQTSGGITPYQYSWANGVGNTAVVNPNFTTTTQFNINVTDACLKVASDSVLVIVDCEFADAGPDTSICLGDTAILTASGGVSYLWSNGDTATVIKVKPTTTTTYVLTATNFFSFTDTDTVTVFVYPLPTVTATANPTTICPNEPADLQAGGALTYQWTSSPIDISLNGQQSIANPVVTPTSTTTYTVVGTDTNTCKNTANVTVNTSLLPVPHIIATPNPVSVFSPIVHLMDGNTSSTTWYWSLGDGATSNQANFYHTYSDQDTGSYLVKLIASNSFGCIDSTEIWVIVRPDGTYYVPNSFTPNGDGLNDEFKIVGMGIEEFELYIYDRWGKLVFESKDVNYGWNGKTNNNDLPAGVYNYLVIYKDNVGIRRSKPGSVTLIR